jgi:hypothetical protein
MLRRIKTESFMSAQSLYIFAIGFLVLSFVGCHSARPYAAAPPRDTEGIERNHGYALLYATIEDETRVDQVLMIKQPRTEVAELLRDIAGFARNAKQQLDEFANTDESLGYDQHGLPHVEAKSRDLTAQTTTRAVMRSTGRDFEITILLTQHEALSYITHIARALREMDEDDNRRAFLADLADESRSLHERAIKLMQAPPVGNDRDDHDE